MEAIQAVAAATQIVYSMVGAVAALEQASRNLEEAPKRIRSLEDFVCELQNLTHRIKQKHVYKLHNPQLDHQFQSLNALIERLHPKIRKARRMVSKSKLKNLAQVVWTSMAGDPLAKLVNSIQDDLNWWLQSQVFTRNVEKVIKTTAQELPNRLKVKSDQGYPTSSKCEFVRNLLEQENSHSHRVILIVGLSGIGKSCLARQVASDPPEMFRDGAVELGFGQWCSRAACNGSKDEYQKRLARKISKFLVQIGFWKRIKNENSGDLEYVCCLLQEALYGKSILILLDDVWEQDIVERFTKLYDNGCKYLVTTRNEAVYEITEAEKVELSKDDMMEISKAILLYHSLLSTEELPGVAEHLLESCGHHPLTVAVMGKALRKELRAEKWETAITNLSTFAKCAPGPLSYVNEKEAENTLTIFGSFEFSLQAMPQDSKQLFITLAALSWVEPTPEACLEAIWSILGEKSMFPLVVCKLVEGSLLMKADTEPLYEVHDMVSLYLDSKINYSIEILVDEPKSEELAFISPWLLIFGKEGIRKISREKVDNFLGVLDEKQAIITLEAILQTLMASKSISDLEASRANFSSILGPRVANLMSTNSQDLITVSLKAIAYIFTKDDYCSYLPSLESSGIIEKLSALLKNLKDPMIQTNVLAVLTKFAEFGTPETVDMVLESIPFDQLAVLIKQNTEDWDESMFPILLSLTKAGKSKAVEKMFAFEIDKYLIKLLENGSEVVQHQAIIALKAFYEHKSPPRNGSLRPANLSLLPWQVRLRLETFVLSDKNIPSSPKPQTLEDAIHRVLDGDKKQVLQAMQDLIPFIEKSSDPRIRDMILSSPLIEKLSELLQYVHPQKHSLRSESAFLLTKLACAGGEPCIKKFLEYDIIPELVKSMHCNITELQDSAYTALHQMLFSNGGVLVLNKIFKAGLIERMVQSLESKTLKTREVNMNCIMDIIELGNKSYLERLLSLQIVKKLVKSEKACGGSGEIMTEFLKGIDKCKHLSIAERRVMKLQVAREVRATLKGHKFETQILAALDACLSDGSRGSSSSSSGRYRK